MNDDEILNELRQADALLEGHFILSSGLHSGRYIQCARALMDPRRAARLCQELVARLPADVRAGVQTVAAPAMGGIICGYEVARALGVRSIFVERPQGYFELRRGFHIEKGEKILLMEDVVTTGLSSREAIQALQDAGGEVIAASCLIDRSGGKADVGPPLYPLLRLPTPSYPADALPPALAAIPAIKPGSRQESPKA